MECKVYYNKVEVRAPHSKQTFLDECYIDHQSIKDEKGQINSIFIHPKEEITLQKIEFHFPIDKFASAKFYCNGFQSWSESYLLEQNDHIPKLRFGANKFFKYYGDAQFEETKAPKQYSWSYAYLKQGSQIYFFGSLSEHITFTLFVYDRKQNTLIATALCDNIKLAHSFPAMKIFSAQGKEPAVFDNYFQLIEKKRPQAANSFGWTSWYKHFNKIEFPTIKTELDNFVESLPKLNNKADTIFFQIDDGFQKNIGDWLELKDSFKSKMPSLTKKIKSFKIQSGIWIAPFICEQKSKIFKNKKDWLLKDEKGNPIKVGYNPLWSGSFYALDIYHKEFRNYLIEVFFTYLNKWNFDMVKVDFLFAAAIQVRKNKTRGQQMHDAISFINELCKGKKILACGTPIGSTFGLVDYCRVSSDTHLKWEHRLLKFLNKRERVSTIGALRSTLNRWQLNKRAFISDPDVFLLRADKNQLTLNQQHTLLLVNVLLGGQLFTSDNLKEYTEEQISELDNLLYYHGSEINSVEQVSKELYEINFTKSKINYKALISLSSRRIALTKIKMEGNLEAYESFIFRDQS